MADGAQPAALILDLLAGGQGVGVLDGVADLGGVGLQVGPDPVPGARLPGELAEHVVGAPVAGGDLGHLVAGEGVGALGAAHLGVVELHAGAVDVELGRGEEPELVLDDRAADVDGVLLVGVGGQLLGPLLVGQGLVDLEVLVAVERGDEGLELVAAGLGDDVHRAAQGAAVLGVHAAGDDLHRLDGVVVHVHREGVRHRVGDVHAVDVELVGVVHAAADVGVAAADHARGHRDDRLVVAAAGGQVAQLLGVEGQARAGGLDVDDGLDVLDDDGGALDLELHLHVDHGGAAGLDLEVLQALGHEAGLGQLQGVGADRELVLAVLACVVGLGLPRPDHAVGGQRDEDAGHLEAVGVRDGAAHLAGELDGPGGGHEEQAQEQRQQVGGESKGHARIRGVKAAGGLIKA